MIHVTQIQRTKVLTYACQSLVADVDTPGLDESTEELHTFTDVTDMQLTHVKLQSQMFLEEPADLRHYGQQPVTVRTDDIGVIDVAAIMPGTQRALHELVKLIEVDVAEELAGEVTDRKATAVRCVEQRLAWVHSYPVFLEADDLTAGLGIEHHDLLGKPADEVDVNLVAPCLRGVAADTVVGHLTDGAGGDPEQTVTLNVHEVAPDVKVHGVAGDCPVLTLLSDVHGQTLDAVVRATAFDAAVGILDESTFKERVGVVEVEMMDDAVSKQRSEDFSLLGIVYDESTWTVGPYSDVRTDHRPAHPCSA